MKKLIGLVLMFGVLVPFSAGAFSQSIDVDNWNTVSGKVLFENVGDKFVVELDGFEVFSASTECRMIRRRESKVWTCPVSYSSVLGSNGEWETNKSIQTKEFKFSVNMNVGNSLKAFMISDGVKTEI